ncbi:MAG: Cysteine desulfurase, SufS subfamily [Candidatus Gottesmanbacteria bacterium GW2011_GWA1_48_13]|uniref:cysteine desulfurase n=2 Tax=Candidatus Gottesmaniibacteriota TaxID=1752720 RepID=A0A0G1UPU3_9BACT|nr:MAG: Cysteine desulfurase, SufS subfamily [Candidatus Gottesmanbacteria bacterium GW2011_GWA1_48_13]
MMDTQKIRKDFPQLKRRINGKPITYLDSTATSLKPTQVLAKMNEYYTKYTANIFRGIYKTSEEATAEYEAARAKVAAFIGANKPEEIVFTRNTSESVNLVAYSWGKGNLRSGDQVAVTIMEHHSNFVPWQQLAGEKSLGFRVWGVDKDGTLNLKELDTLITRKTKLLAITAVSNVIGTINPIKEIVRRVKKLNPKCIVLVDGAQAVPHMRVDVAHWGADFVAFSSHKMLGPTGVGVLWGRMELLEAMPPFIYGGDMIKEVHRDTTVYNSVPHKFEAGTPHIAGVIGLGAAVDYLSVFGMDNVRSHEKEITEYALEKLAGVSGLQIIGPNDPEVRGGVLAFVMKGIHPHDIAQILDEDNVCIRVGFHCAQPLHEYLAVGPTARASFYVYTTKEEIDALVAGLGKVKKMLG